jgi:hypothetical protein
MGSRWSPSLLSERAFGSNQGNGGLAVTFLAYRHNVPQMEHIVFFCTHKWFTNFVFHLYSKKFVPTNALHFIYNIKMGVLFGVQMYDYFCSHICIHKIIKFVPTKSRHILYSTCTHKYFVLHLYPQIYIDKILILRYNLYIN